MLRHGRHGNEVSSSSGGYELPLRKAGSHVDLFAECPETPANIDDHHLGVVEPQHLSRAVVEDDQFPVRVVLAQERLNSLPQPATGARAAG
jgi:hypothetical protein